jgi:hypothetical protein
MAFSPINAVQHSTNPLLLSVNDKSIDSNQIMKVISDLEFWSPI